MKVLIEVSVPHIGKCIKAQRLETGQTLAKVATEALISVNNLYLTEWQKC